MKKQRKPQAQKNTAYMRKMQEIRRSNATTPIPSGKSYKRPKAGGRNRDWDA